MDRLPGGLMVAWGTRLVTPDHDEPFGPLAVGLAVEPGAPQVDAFAADLERESVAMWRMAAPVAGAAAPDGATAVVLVWLPAGVSPVRLAEMVAWRGQLARSIPLIGCAPLGGTEDSERALAAGFDDFVAGRSAPREMARRLRAVVRRSARRRRPAPSQRTRFGPVRIEPGEHRLWVDGKRISVTRTELAVMTVLVEAGGQSRSRADILARAWGADALEVGERAVDNVVMRLRRKLPEPDLIVTVRGVGFRLDS